jgi:hypothetical protein
MITSAPPSPSANPISIARPETSVVFALFRGISTKTLRMIRTRSPSSSGATQPNAGAMMYATCTAAGSSGRPAHFPFVCFSDFSAAIFWSTRSGSKTAPATSTGSGVRISGSQAPSS